MLDNRLLYVVSSDGMITNLYIRGSQLWPVLVGKLKKKFWSLGYSDNYLFPDIT